jgi:NAD+ synthase
VKLPDLDHEVVAAKLKAFIVEQTEEAGTPNVVVGASGGLDSSVAMALCALALGPERVYAISMPAHATSDESCDEAERLAGSLLVPHLHINLTTQLDAYFDRFPGSDPLRRGNKAARERMAVLYDQAKALSALVCGTSNRSEMLMGYGTVHGDLACSFYLVGDLYKSEIRGLARWLEIPESICARPPSAELWEGQTDETDLGWTYEELDLLLWAMVDRGMDDQELLEGGFTPEMIEAVRGRMAATEFKRRMPSVCLVHGS